MKLWHHKLGDLLRLSLILVGEVLELPHLGLDGLSQNMEFLPFIRMSLSQLFEILVGLIFGDLLGFGTDLRDLARAKGFSIIRLFIRILRFFRLSILGVVGLGRVLISIFINLMTLIISSRLVLIFSLTR